MIKFFKKNRQRLLSENRFGRYIIYALGEILIVIIGILLAIRINTWNNELTAKKHLAEVYNQIQKDLVIDTLSINEVINYYREKDKRIQDILDKKIKPSFYNSITSHNIKEYSICRLETASWELFKPMTKGYNLLTNSGLINTISKDSLSDVINNFYINELSSVETFNLKISNLVYENIKVYEQYSWFADWANNNYNKDYLTFVFEGETYRNQLVRNRIYTVKNYVTNLERYKIKSINILNSISEIQKQ